MDVTSNATIEEVKNRIQIKEGVPKNVQLLVFHGVSLIDSNCLNDYEIRKNVTLNLLLKLRGGGNEEDIAEGIKNKRSRKCILSRRRNVLFNQISKGDVDSALEGYEEEYWKTVEEWSHLMELCQIEGKLEEAAKIAEEIKDIEEKNANIEGLMSKLALKELTSVQVATTSTVCRGERPKTLERLKKLTIPIFSGQVSEYQSWKAAFEACIGSAEGSKEEKMLHLRQYLSGEALNRVSRLGYSALSYDMAIEQLEEYYGGAERRSRVLMESVDKFMPLREGSLRDLEALISLLDSLTIQSKESLLDEFQGKGFLYQRLLKKLTVGKLNEWSKNIIQRNVEEGIQSLKEWLKEEAKIMRRTEEILHGSARSNLSPQGTNFFRRNNNDFRNHTNVIIASESARTNFVGQKRADRYPQISKDHQLRPCVYCNEVHRLDQCPGFQKMSVDDRIKLVVQKRLCQNCLKPFHNADSCFKEISCKRKGCMIKHSYWLHKVQVPDEKHERTLFVGDDKSTTEYGRRWISLRTIPVILEKNGRMIKVNALLDDASTVSYVSERVSTELCLEGCQRKMPIMVVGGKTEEINTRMVKMRIKNVDGTLNREFNALSLKTVTGDMRVIDWRKASQSWQHLKGIRFPAVSERNSVDVLIGADYLELQMAIREIRGKHNEPIARQTPLGWTCVGGPSVGFPLAHKTNFVRTFFSKEPTVEDILTRFWEVEEVDLEQNVSRNDQLLLEKVKAELSYNDKRFQIGLPWKEDRPELPSVGRMAEDRLIGLERRFAKDNELMKEYEKIKQRFCFVHFLA